MPPSSPTISSPSSSSSCHSLGETSPQKYIIIKFTIKFTIIPVHEISWRGIINFIIRIEISSAMSSGISIAVLLIVLHYQAILILTTLIVTALKMRW
jgi:hypothetical protein